MTNKTKMTYLTYMTYMTNMTYLTNMTIISLGSKIANKAQCLRSIAKEGCSPSIHR